MKFKGLRKIVRTLEGTNVSELEIREENLSVRVVRAVCPPLPVSASPMMTAMPMTPFVPSFMTQPQMAAPPSSGGEARVLEVPRSEVAPPPPAPNLVAITSPMIGTFYRAISPEVEPFVEVNDMVEKGQALCIIEAMKLMNEIDSDVSGRIVRILKQNATPVEFGEELFLIEPI